MFFINSQAKRLTVAIGVHPSVDKKNVTKDLKVIKENGQSYGKIH